MFCETQLYNAFNTKTKLNLPIPFKQNKKNPKQNRKSSTLFTGYVAHISYNSWLRLAAYNRKYKKLLLYKCKHFKLIKFTKMPSYRYSARSFTSSYILLIFPNFSSWSEVLYRWCPKTDSSMLFLVLVCITSFRYTCRTLVIW